MKSPVINTKVYLIGTVVNSTESVLVLDSKASALLHFTTLESAKQSFSHAYKLLLAPSFQPSNPPSQEEILYHQEFMRLLVFSPMILELEKEHCAEHLMQWKKKENTMFTTKHRLYNIDYWHCPMKDGFLKRFCILDIVQDIESTAFVGPDGKMVTRKSNVNYSGDADSTDTQNGK